MLKGFHVSLTSPDNCVMINNKPYVIFPQVITFCSHFKLCVDFFDQVTKFTISFISRCSSSKSTAMKNFIKDFYRWFSSSCTDLACFEVTYGFVIYFGRSRLS